MYLRLFSAFALCTALAFTSGCSDSASSSPQVQVFTEIASPNVHVIKNSNGSTIQVGSSDADSLTITRARILISRMKLHRVNEDENTGDREVKAGPFVLTLNGGASASVLTGDVPEGNYDRIKFEMHKFSSSEEEQYKNDPALRDFATSDRYTVIIDGTVYKGGKETSFVYNGDVTANLSLSLGTTVNVSSAAVAGILIRLDAASSFKIGGVVLNPTDPNNATAIANAVKASIRALKK